MSTDAAGTSYCSVVRAAQLTGVSVSRVRYLLRAGLIRGASADEQGAPLFGQLELLRLRKIRRLSQDLGVNMAGVEIILRLTDELSTLRAGSSPGQTEGG